MHGTRLQQFLSNGGEGSDRTQIIVEPWATQQSISCRLLQEGIQHASNKD